jgi:hypothetical protein
VTDNAQQVVFIDSRVPDIQDLIDGVQPGVQVFVIDPGSDGVQQIADILAANDLHDLSSISIVSHGADGEVMLGSTTLSEANLASYSRALAEIGTAVAPGGDIQLYGCDVALGSSGQQFINDFSTLTGGVTVDAATHVVGSANFGGSWTLDASSNNPAPGGSGSPAGTNGPVGDPLGSSTTAAPNLNVASPFTSQALANFQGSLVAPPDGQLWFVTDGGTVDTREEFVDSNGASQTIEINDASTTNPLGAFPADIVFDPGTGFYFMTEDGGPPDLAYGGNVLEGTLYSSATPATVYSVDSNVTTVGGTIHGLFGEALAIDTTQHIVYLGIGGSNEPTNEGIFKLSYDPTTGSVTTQGFLINASQASIAAGKGIFDVHDMALDTTNHEIYFVSWGPSPNFPKDQIYAVDVNNPTSVTTLFPQSDFPTDFSNGYIVAVTVDAVHGEVYFATESQHPNGTSTLNAIWEVSTAGGTPVRVADYPVGTFPNDLAFDESSRQLIIVDQANENILFEQLDSTGLTITGTSTITPSAASIQSTPEGLAFDSLPTLTGLVGTLAQPTEEHGAVTLASGITLTDIDSPSLAGATVFFGSGSFTGASDTLAADTTGTNITASYNSATETLTLSGQDSFAHYATVLDRVTFTAGENPTNFGSTPTRVIDWVVTDGLQDIPFGASNSAQSTITVVFVNDAPTLNGVASTAQFTEHGGAATLSGTLSVIDVDDINLSSATISITGGSFVGDTDTLAVSGAVGGSFDGGKITVSYNTTSQTLTLTGADTLAEYQAALREVTFSSGENPTNFGANTTRTISWVAMDPSGTAIGGQDTSSVSLTILTVTNVNDPPTLALGTTVASWIEHNAATTLSPSVAITDADDLDLVNATVSITGGAFAGDQLEVAGQTSGVTIAGTHITPTFTGNGVVIFSGSDTLADYQSALELVTYNGGENPTDFGSDLTRTLTWTLNDGSGTANSGSQIGTATSTINVTFINDPPSFDSVATGAQYTEEGSATSLAGSLASVTDVDDLNLKSATVAIEFGSFAGATDTLAIGGLTIGTLDSNKISFSYNSTTETLTLTGTDTLAAYQTALDEVTFSSGENPTNFGSNTTRTISWLLQDPSGTLNGGVSLSTFATTTVTITNVNDPPALTLGTTTAAWTEEPGTAVSLSPSATVTDPDNQSLASATVQITGGTFAGDGDTLAIGGATSGTVGAISFSYNSSTEALTLTGSDTLANYQTALETVTFHAGENPADFQSNPTRTLTWTLNDGSASFSTGTATSTVSVTFINDAPTLAGVPSSITGTPHGTVVLASSTTVTDVDDVFLRAATVQITGGTFAGDGDVLTAEGLTSGTFPQNGHTISISYNSTTETLTLTGSDTLADYQNVLDTVAWHSTAGDPINSGSNTSRTLSWTVQDISGVLNGGVDTSTPDSETLTLDTPPTLSGVTTSASWTEEQSPLTTTLSPNVTISDPDGVNSQLSATVAIVGGTFGGDHDTLAINGALTGTLDSGNISFSYNSSTETLVLTGSDTLAAYQNALDLVTFNAGENPTNFGSNPTRTLTWTVADHVGTESSPVTTTVNLTNVNDPPTLGNVATTAFFTEHGGAATLSSSVSVTDPDDLNLVSATVQITGGTFSGDGDTLAIGGVTSGTLDSGKISYSYNSTTETLTLTGSDTLAAYQNALDTITFNAGENPTDFGSNLSRTVVWTLNDGSGTANGGVQVSTPVTSFISITNVNDAPTLSNVPASANFTEEGGAVTLASAVSIVDVDDINLSGATVKITGGSFAGDGDVLSATGTSSIVVSYNSSTETLTLTGTDTLAHYQAVLDSVTFNAGENPTDFGSNPTRTLTWTLTDPSGTANGGVNVSAPVTSTVSVTNVNDPPTLGNVATTAFFTEHGSAVTLSSAVSVTDPDDLDLVSATVKITGGTFSGDGDTLAATATGNITVSYNSSTETLALTGSDTLANYQTVLDSVTFNDGENPTNFGSNPTRTVTWTLNDGSGSNNLSTAVTSTINITNINDAPTLANVATSQSFTEEGGAVILSSSVSVTDPDDVNLSGATVKIIGGTFANDGDVLAATTASTNITASYNSSTETLTLTGTDTLAHYQSVLDSVTFNAGENPNNYGSNPIRTLTWTLTDPSGTANGGVNVSTPVTSTVSITNVNDQPTLTNVATLVSFQPHHTITISPAISVLDPDNLTLANATVKITGGSFAGDGDVLGANVAGTSITASYNSSTETLTLTGSDTLAHYQSVLDSVTFSSGPNPSNGNINRTRTVSWVVNDGSASNNLSTAATTTISIGGQVRNDFDGDNKSDLLLQNQPFSGNPNVMVDLLSGNGATIASSATITTPPGWTVQASGDFNQDNKADIILQAADGLPEIWFMNGTSVTSTVTLPNSGPTWHVIATGDFNADGNTDILWQANDGAADIWLMNGTSIVSAALLPFPGAGWHAIGAGDFNGDGKSDILWQNTDGAAAIWEMNGTNLMSGALLPFPGAGWHAIGVGDFNGDGKADILWQNTDGAADIWLMNGTTLLSGTLLPFPGAGWHAIGTSDFNGDGKADIVWQNDDGRPAIWLMNGTTLVSGALLPNPGATWHVKDDGPIPSDATAGAQPPALHLSMPDMTSAVPMQSSPNGAAGSFGAPAGNASIGGLPPQSAPEFAATWSSLNAGPEAPSWMRPLNAGPG